MALIAGTKLGPYEIQSPLGAGGMGEVYRARDTRLDRIVAIKILPPHLSDNSEAKLRFEREAKSISSLNHPHICTLYDVGSQEGIGFLVMEFLEGETLADRLPKGRLSLEQMLKHGIDICEGLEKAHRDGVVHRDLKPGNIMLTKGGAKLMDFGLAKAATANPLSSGLTQTLASPATPLTAAGTIVGTFQYMSPEQLQGQEADARSDIFALGAVLYEMITGKRAFPGKTQISVLSAILEKDPEPVTATQPLAPPALHRLVVACLAKNPEERIQTAHDVKLQLQWIAEGEPQERTRRAARRTRGQRVWSTAGIALAAIFAGLGGAYFWRPVPPRQVVRSSILPPEKSSFAQRANDEGPVAISPDGSRIVVSVTVQGSRDILYVRPLNALSGQILAGTEGAIFPFWSPDSRSIGFFADGQLKTIDVSGGPVHAVCPAPQGRGGTWSREGVIIFAPTPLGGLLRVAATGGVPVAVTKLDAARREDTHRWPQFLPDGRHFLYLARTLDITSSEIRLASIDSMEWMSVLSAAGNCVYVPPGFLLYPRGNLLLAQRFDADHFRLSGEPVPIADDISWNGNVNLSAFSVSANEVLVYTRNVGEGVSELIWTDRSGKILEKVGDPGGYFAPRLSPDGRKLAVEVYDPNTHTNSDIWIYDLMQGSRTRLTFSQANEYNRMPVWSPDGNRIVFSSVRGKHSQIYEKAVSGIESELLVSPSEGNRYATTWSPDGRWIAGIQQNPQQGGTEFLLLPMAENQKPITFLPGAPGLSRFAFPRISPNGKWIAFSTWESGLAEIYLSSFPSGAGRWQVTAKGGFDVVWRRDGKELFYVGLDDTLMSAEISEREERPVVGKIQTLFRTHRVPSPNWTFDVSPDRNRFLINSLMQPSTPEPITMVVNWDAELKKK
jgi:serine/threonine protein kinase